MDKQHQNGQISPSENDHDTSVEHFESSDGRMTWGWSWFRPKCLQGLASPRWFLFFISIFSLVQGMAVNSFVSIAIPTLEKQFNLSSFQTGVIVSANDITALILVCFVSFHGDFGHKTKWLSAGAVLTGIGCLLFALPYFLIEKTDISVQTRKSYGLCKYNSTTSTSTDSTCEKQASSAGLYMLVFMLSQLLSGAGTTPLHTVGTAYLDENAHPKYTAVYIGLFYSTVMLGPGIGNMIGGQLLKIYVDVKLPADVKVSTASPAWVGAWWLGPLVCGFILILVGPILLGFPRHLPKAQQRRKKAIREGFIKANRNTSGRMKEIIPVTKSLLFNGTFMFQNMALTLSALVAAGLGPFLFKIIRIRYGGTRSAVGIAIGLILIPGAGGGIAIGSLFVKVLGLKESCKKSAKVAFILQLIGIWTALIFMIPGCDNTLFAGVDKPYINSTIQGLDSKCNSLCSCSKSTYKPVCGPNNTNYYSPCFAGCTQAYGNKTYGRCACLPPTTPPLKDIKCDRKCKNLIPFILGAIMLSLFSFSNAIPSKMVTLRSVPDNQRGYALGLQFLFIRAFGSLIGPIAFGRLLDTTCTLRKCGYCLNYDHIKMSKLLLATALPINALSCLGYYLSWLCSRRRENSITDNDESLDQNNANKRPSEDTVTREKVGEIEKALNQNNTNMNSSGGLGTSETVADSDI